MNQRGSSSVEVSRRHQSLNAMTHSQASRPGNLFGAMKRRCWNLLWLAPPGFSARVPRLIVSCAIHAAWGAPLSSSCQSCLAMALCSSAIISLSYCYPPGPRLRCSFPLHSHSFTPVVLLPPSALLFFVSAVACQHLASPPAFCNISPG